MYVKYPVNNVGITSLFGVRVHPITNVSKYHYGLDLGWIKYQGEGVYATYDATVIEEGYNSSMGNYIILKYNKDNNTIINIYMHLKQRSLIKKGKEVKQGQILGYMGETGLAQGVHLHFEYWVCPKDYKYNSNDASKYAKDPLKYLYLFDDQTVTTASSNKVNTVVGIPVKKDNNKEQVEVLKEYLNCRNGYSLTSKILGYANIGYYNVLDKKESDGYVWYKIDSNKWIASVKDYVKAYNKEEEKEEETSNELLDYDSFTALKDGYYYIYLNSNEMIYYPKSKDNK